MARWTVRLTLGGVVIAAALQLLPFGRIEGRPVTAEAPWPSREARDLAVAACYDCHSNEPTLQWFDRIAPGSWVVAGHVRDGRRAVNFSEWDRPQDEADDLADAVEDGEMPLVAYTWLHREARLDEAERRTLLAALRALDSRASDDRRGRGGRDDAAG